MILSINWSNIFIIIFIGFGLVFVVLILLVYILEVFGYIARRTEGNKENSKKDTKTNAGEVNKGGLSNEESAAIAMALSLFYADVHDEESYLITIQDNNNSSWNSKIFGLNNFSE